MTIERLVLGIAFAVVAIAGGISTTDSIATSAPGTAQTVLADPATDDDPRPFFAG